MKKSIFLFILALLMSGFLFSEPAKALDQKCWREEDCVKARINLGISPEEARKQGVYQGTDAEEVCGKGLDTLEKIGFCVAVGNVDTNITFGSRKSFTGIVDFIQFIYQYSVVVIGVLAVAVMIFAGFGWMISGGSPDKITESKKRIGGAVMGLLIALLSYTILNLVNPYLVNLRAPQVWLINPMALTTPFCKDIKGSEVKFAMAYSQKGAKMSDEVLLETFKNLKSEDFNITTSTDPKTGAGCSNYYFPKNGNGATCLGLACEKGYVCSPGLQGERHYECVRGSITGKIYAGGLDIYNETGAESILELFSGREFWAWKWADDFVLYGICGNGETSGKIGTQTINPSNVFEESTKRQVYSVLVREEEISEAKNSCQGKKGPNAEEFRGFVIGADLNESGLDLLDEDHYIGRIGNTAVDLGDESNSDSDCLLRLANGKYFFTEEEIRNGVVFDINVSNIYDVDITSNDEDRAKFYKSLGYDACVGK